MAPGTPSRGTLDPTRRRSQRVIITLAITIRSVDTPKEKSFDEETHTLVVNVHGALIVLGVPVAKGQKLQMINRATKQEQLCRVASLGPASGGKIQIGVEFLKPTPDFWHISFPPEDWVVPEPAPAASDK
jgi:hypothetical protein